MRRFRYLLLAAAALSSPAYAQRPPLYGVWFGPMECGPSGGRMVRMFMYGNGTGLLELGTPPYAPGTGTAIAEVVVQQPAQADYVLIDRWIANTIQNPPMQLSGRLGQDGSFSGQVIGDPHCSAFNLQMTGGHQWLLRRGRERPQEVAEMEARSVNPHWTPRDMIEAAIVLNALRHGIGTGRPAPGVSRPLPGEDEPERAPALPSVQGDVQGNLPADIQGNRY